MKTLIAVGTDETGRRLTGIDGSMYRLIFASRFGRSSPVLCANGNASYLALPEILTVVTAGSPALRRA